MTPVRSILKRARRRGSALMATLIVIAMLLAVVVALHYYQGISRQTYMIEEASLRFREGYRFAQRKEITGLAVPSDLLVAGSADSTDSTGVVSVEAGYGKKIFDRSNGLPDLRALEKSPAHRYFKITPSTADVGLRVFGKNTYTTVITGVPGYAAYAPKGNINIHNMEGWANPDFKDTREADKAYSGARALAAARKDVTLGNVTYGEAHTIEGKAVAGGDGVTFKQPKFPLQMYSAKLIEEVESARNALQQNATNSGDKTNSLVSPSTGPEAILNLFFGGGSGLEQFLSLRNATHFWLPMIPSMSSAPPYYWQFAFSLPYPPDNANYTANEGLNDQLSELGKQAAEAGQKLVAADAALKAAKEAYAQNSSEENLAKVMEAQAEVDKWTAICNDLNSKIEALSGPQTQDMKNKMAQGMRGVPLTRAQDPDGNDGITGWNYSKAGELMWSVVSFIFTFNAESIATKISNPDVKLIHFGGKDRDYQWFLDENHMVIDATMTVPRGRTLRLKSNNDITIAGDLWLQRGSTFYADCQTLKIQPGRKSDPSKFFTPAGRIILEEGATLICRGDVVCVGSSKWGSVIVCGVPSKVHPLNSAIIANSVQLDGGVFAGTAIDDLLEGLGLDNNTLRDLNNKLIRPLISSIGPNAGKVLGAFWARRPYFAKYATTFQVIFPPMPPFGQPSPIPVVTPIPLPIKNVLVPVAQGLGWVYSITLNMSLGENFYTHADWWVFGEGVVPVIPQVDPVKAAAVIANFPNQALDSLDPETIIKTFVESAVKDMVGYLVEKVIQEIVKKVAAAAIPYGGLAAAAGDLLTDATNNFLGREDKQKNAGESLTAALTDAVKNAAESTLGGLATKFSTEIENEFLREYNGILVYADNNITIGGRNATGFFLSKNGNINIQSRQCVGVLLAENGNIECRHLLFYPYFNRASLYKPKQTPNNWFDRALVFDYDSAYDSKEAVDIGPPAIHGVVSAQGWTK